MVIQELEGQAVGHARYLAGLLGLSVTVVEEDGIHISLNIADTTDTVYVKTEKALITEVSMSPL